MMQTKYRFIVQVMLEMVNYFILEHCVMVEAVIPGLPTGRASVSEAVEVMRPESDVADGLREVADNYPDLSLGSYPFQREQRYGTSLVVRGLDGARVAAAMADLRARLAL